MNILDTTVRDGSYLVDFKFTCDDVKNLVNKSAKLGVEYIEIGHGMGLSASSAEHGMSLHTDIEYMDAVNHERVRLNAKIGMFCIPGIAKLQDLKQAKNHGVDFVRIGCNATDFEKAVPYIKEAKKHNLIVMNNLMKSYILTPKEFAEVSKSSAAEGTDVVYIVDSAGSMTSEMLDCYIDEIKENTDVKLGFHGHNNMGLAVCNTVHAAKKGVDFIDCTFQGIGRSLGNASLEQTVMTLKKSGFDIDMDMACLLEYGYSALRNVVDKRLMHPLDMMCGYAGFHSGYLKHIYRCCVEKNVDPLRLILAYSEINKKDMDYEMLLHVADSLPTDTADNPYTFKKYFSEKYSDDK